MQNVFKLIHLDITNYPYVLLVQKTKIPIVMYYLFLQHNCRVADHGAEMIYAMILYENCTYPQRGKQPSRPKPQTSSCTQMLFAVNLIRKGLCLVLQTQEAETSSVPRAAARSARCVCFERAGHTGSELVSSWLLTSRLM